LGQCVNFVGIGNTTSRNWKSAFFVVPAAIVKNKHDRLIVLNDVAKKVIDSHRGRHETRVVDLHRNLVPFQCLFAAMIDPSSRHGLTAYAEFLITLAGDFSMQIQGQISVQINTWRGIFRKLYGKNSVWFEVVLKQGGDLDGKL